MPTERQLQVFLTAAAAGSFRRTAEALGISQASVSKQIEALERSVGGPVFLRRRGARAELSLLGLTLQRDANRILALQRKMTGARAAPDAMERLTVYVRSFLLETAIKPNMDAYFARGLPNQAKFVIVDDTEEMTWRVCNDRASIGLLRADTLPAGAAIRVAALGHEACSLYASPELARKVRDGLIKRSELPVLLPRRGSQVSDFMLEKMEEAGFGESQFRFGSQFLEVLIDEAALGTGAAMLLETHAEKLAREGKIVKIEESIAHLSLFAIGNTLLPLDQFNRLVNVFAVDGTAFS